MTDERIDVDAKTKKTKQRGMEKREEQKQDEPNPVKKEGQISWEEKDKKRLRRIEEERREDEQTAEKRAERRDWKRKARGVHKRRKSKETVKEERRRGAEEWIEQGVKGEAWRGMKMRENNQSTANQRSR